MTLRLLVALTLAGCVTQTTAGTSDSGIITDRPDTAAPDGVSPSDAPKPLPELPVVDECTADADCDDGLYCNGAETCNPVALGAGAGGCLPGEPPVPEDADLDDCDVPTSCNEDTDTFDRVTLEPGEPCDDGIACTREDACTETSTCEGKPVDSRCDDGLFCNGVEHCNREFGCLPGAAPLPTDADPGDCLVPGACDEATDSHPLVPAEVGRSCNDEIVCTVLDGCTSAGTCAGEPDDLACSDSLFCNGAEVCSVGVGCIPGTAPAGNDDDPNDCLVVGSCDEEADAWTLVPATLGASCDDAVGCTLGDSCDAAGACAGAPNDAVCSNGLACDGVEACAPAAATASTGCIAGSPPEPPEDVTPEDCWIIGPCDEGHGGYALVPAVAGTTCSDAVDCTNGDTCGADGVCAGSPSHDLCDNGVSCDGVETCDALGCVPGTPPEKPEDTEPLDCYVWSECTEDGFKQTHAPYLTSCDDSIACTLNDYCVDGSCSGTRSDADCDNGAWCDGQEVCSVIGCAPGTPPAPPLAQPCKIVGPCDELTDEYPVSNVADGTGCGDDSVCVGGDCIFTPPP